MATKKAASKPAAKSPHKARLKSLQKALKEQELDAIIVREPKNVRHLVGFVGTYGVLVVDSGGAHLVTDGRYAEIAEGAVDGAKVIVQPTSGVPEFFSGLFKQWGYGKLGFEGSVAWSVHEQLGRQVKKAKTKLVEAGSLLVDLRRCKDDGEIATIKKAAGIADKMMQLAWDTARVGVSEEELSRAIRRGAEDLGAEGESFPNLVASGPNASRPHHHPMKRRLRKGDMITIDLGAVVDGYCSDLTRNPVLGKSSLQYDAMYEVCLAAQQAGIKACTAGAAGKDVDAVARDIIASAGYGDYFNHGLGHGVGLDIHEAPRLSPASTDTLRAGDVVTVEPGIYIPGFGGLRIEDLLVVTDGKPRVLSRITKNLVILPA